MATSSVTIPPTQHGKRGHFTFHSRAANSRISNTRGGLPLTGQGWPTSLAGVAGVR
jgi:hypothetical protein